MRHQTENWKKPSEKKNAIKAEPFIHASFHSTQRYENTCVVFMTHHTSISGIYFSSYVLTRDEYTYFQDCPKCHSFFRRRDYWIRVRSLREVSLLQ